MPKKVLVYRGWIGGKESDRVELERMGVELGRWNPIGTFDYCNMTSQVYVVFTRKWKGRGVWGLIGRWETAYVPSVDGDEDIPF